VEACPQSALQITYNFFPKRCRTVDKHKKLLGGVRRGSHELTNYHACALRDILLVLHGGISEGRNGRLVAEFF
jgi:hypothetical protein